MTTVTGHGIFGHSKDQTSKSLIRCNQEMYYNFRCDITGTGNRSLTQLISNGIEVCYKEVDIEASSLHLQYRYDTAQTRNLLQVQLTMGGLNILKLVENISPTSCRSCY